MTNVIRLYIKEEVVAVCERNRQKPCMLTAVTYSKLHIAFTDVTLKADYKPLSFHFFCPSQSFIFFFPTGQTLDCPLDKGTGNKYGPMASACYAKEHVHIDAFGILSTIDPPSALHIYTF